MCYNNLEVKMKNILLISISISFLLFCCIKNKNEINSQNDNGNNAILKNNTDAIINDYIDIIDNVDIINNDFTLIYNSTLSKICKYIRNDLELEFKYNSLKSIFNKLQYTQNNTYQIIEHKFFQNSSYSHTGTEHYYIIQYGYFKLNLMSFDDISNDESNLFLIGIEIELNDYTYIKLFPFLIKDEFIIDKDFGYIDEIGDDYILYFFGNKDGPAEHCQLIFINSLLKSLKMEFYKG